MTGPSTQRENPPPGYLPLPPLSLPDLNNTPGWYDAGFRAWGFVFTPGEGAVMVAGTESDSAVWWMLQKAAACCNSHSGFSATAPRPGEYVRGVGCDVALITEKPQHAPNPLAEEALRVVGKYLGAEHYPHPLKGTVCLYMPYMGYDNDDAHALAPELVAAVADVDKALARARRAAEEAEAAVEADPEGTADV